MDEMVRPVPLWKDPVKMLATWFGAGLLPKAPGTWGSLAALPFAWAMADWGGPALLAVATLVVTVVGWIVSDAYVRRTGVNDPSEVVIDEVAGQWLTLLAVPPDPVFYVAGFALFRLFDIRKPWPVGWADRELGGGLGVMVDDLLAGVYATLVLNSILLLPIPGLVQWLLS